MRTRVRAALALCTLVLAGCLREETIEPIRDSIAVHAVAVVGASTMGVTIAEVSSSGEAAPLNGATVRVFRAQEELALLADGETSSFCFAGQVQPGEAQCYGAALASPIEAGETIDIEIELPDGTRITGSTTTPAPPVVESPAANSRVDAVFVLQGYGNGYSLQSGVVEIRWSGPPGGVTLRTVRLFDDGAEVDCGEFVYQDSDAYTRSPASLHAPSHCAFDPQDPVWDSAHVEVHVATYDASLAAYMAATDESSEGVVADAASPGLDIASGDVLLVGVFGSTARAAVPFGLRGVVVERPGSGVSGSRASGAPGRSAAAP